MKINEKAVTDLVLRKQVTAGRLFSLIREVKNLYKDLSCNRNNITGDLSLVMDDLSLYKFREEWPEGIFYVYREQ